MTEVAFNSHLEEVEKLQKGGSFSSLTSPPASPAVQEGDDSKSPPLPPPALKQSTSVVSNDSMMMLDADELLETALFHGLNLVAGYAR